MKRMILFLTFFVLVLALLLSACSGERAGEAVKVVKTGVDDAGEDDVIAAPQVSIGGVPVSAEQGSAAGSP